MTVRGELFFTVLVCTMLWLLLMASDNARSAVLYSVGMYHSLAVVFLVTMLGAGSYTVLECTILWLAVVIAK